MSSIHKHYFVSTTLATLGAVIVVTALDKSKRQARVTQAPLSNGDMIVDFTDTEKVERVWVATVSKLPTAEEHRAALKEHEEASELRQSVERKKKGGDTEVEKLRGVVAEQGRQIDELKSLVEALTAPKPVVDDPKK